MNVEFYRAVTKSRTGTRGSGTQGRGTQGSGNQGLGDLETRRLGDPGTPGLWDVGREEVGTQRRAGTRRRNKQTAPDFCIDL